MQVFAVQIEIFTSSKRPRDLWVSVIEGSVHRVMPLPRELVVVIKKSSLQCGTVVATHVIVDKPAPLQLSRLSLNLTPRQSNPLAACPTRSVTLTSGRWRRRRRWCTRTSRRCARPSCSSRTRASSACASSGRTRATRIVCVRSISTNEHQRQPHEQTPVRDETRAYRQWWRGR